MGTESEIYQRLAAVEAMREAQKEDRRAIYHNRERIRALENRDPELDHIPTLGDRVRSLERDHQQLESKITDLQHYLESRFWVATTIVAAVLGGLQLLFKIWPG